jgi:GNAT superfamily N-acetyltransferase
VSGFATYLDSLMGSWRALAVPQSGARVLVADGYVAARFPAEPILDNALLFESARLPEVEAIYAGVDRYAVWASEDCAAAALLEAGYARDEVTVAMVCQLAEIPPVQASITVEPTRVEVLTELNGVPDSMLQGVPACRAYATADQASGALLIEVGTDLNVSFVATRPEMRRRGLATAVLQHALREAHQDGFVTASLQATAMGTQVYRRLGFRQVGVWQEWVSERGDRMT